MSGYMPKSKSTEWETPQWLFDKLNDIFNFIIDGACTYQNCKCPCASVENDSIEWTSATFVNPPYGKELNNFIKKAKEQHLKYETDIVLLIPASTEIKAWHEHIWPFASYILFLKGRVNFELNGKKIGASPKGSAVIIYSPDYLSEFAINKLSELGKVIDLRN
jgi:phage N-6-adenine-methyltransferase